MKNAFKFVVLSGVLSFASGCVIHHRPFGHVPHHPRHVHHPHVVVVKPPSPPPPRVVVVKPHAPPPPVVVVKPTPPPKPPVFVVTPPPTRRVQPLEPAGPIGHAVVNVTIAPRERQVIREWVIKHDDHGHHKAKGKGKSLPPGLAKKVARGGSLPPGWQRKLATGQVMEAEVYRQCEPLPQEVIVHLPPPPPGTILVRIEGKVVRLAQATLEILDVFDVF